MSRSDVLGLLRFLSAVGGWCLWVTGMLSGWWVHPASMAAVLGGIALTWACTTRFRRFGDGLAAGLGLLGATASSLSDQHAVGLGLAGAILASLLLSGALAELVVDWLHFG